MLAAFLVLLGGFGVGSYFLWYGFVLGIIRKKLPGGPERPQGWSGSDAVYVGTWMVCFGAMGFCIGASALVHLLQGGGPTTEWTSLSGWFIGFPGMSFYLASGLVAFAFAWRSRSLRWALIGALSSAMAVTGLVFYARLWFSQA